MESKFDIKPVYGGLALSDGVLHFHVLDKEQDFGYFKIIAGDNIPSSVISWLRQYSNQNNSKFISIGICSPEVNLLLFSKLWLELDIVPLHISPNDVSTPQKAAEQAAIKAEGHFDEHDSFSAKVGADNKVETPPLVRLENFEEITDPKLFRDLITQAKNFEGKKITFFSATPQGGGVAIMRHALLRLFDLLNVNASWHVMTPDPDIFLITKEKFHNVLQSVNHVGTLLNDEDKNIFDKWSEDNAQMFKNVIKESDVIVIDDPQASGLAPHIRQMKPDVKLVYRSHIQLLAELANTPSTPQSVTWDYIWHKIESVDLFIAHPIPEFVPKEISQDKLIFMPPSTDPLDGLNKELKDDQKAYYFSIFNKILINQNLTPMDSNRPYIVQIARFDPSKGIPDVLEAYAKLRAMQHNGNPIPQLAIIGNSSVDDPDGKPIFDMTVELINEKYSDYSHDIKVVRAPHYDQLMNTMLRKAAIALQLSHKEGYEFKITEAVMKGIPTIIYDSGGMPLQIKHEKTGFIVNKGDTDKVAEYMFKLLTDQQLYRDISANASQNYNKEATTVPNALKWLKIGNNLVQEPTNNNKIKWD